MKNVVVGSLLVFCCAWSGNTWSSKHSYQSIRPTLKKGEFLRFDAKIGEIKGGYCTITTQKVTRSRKGLELIANLKARTNHFFDKVHRVNNRFTSQFGLYPESPFSYSIDVDQAGSILKRQVRFHQQARHGHLHLRAHYKKLRGKVYKRSYHRRRRAPRDTHNLVSALYQARFIDYKPGKTFSFHVYVTGRLWHIEGRMARVTKIYTIMGSKKVLEIHAKAKRTHKKAKVRHIRVWLSADKYRIPFRIQGYIPYIGTATAELSGYRRSRRSPYINSSTRRKRKKRNRVWSFLSQF